MRYMVWLGIFLFMLKLISRRQVKYEFNTEAFKRNLDLVAGTEVDRIAHPDTLANVMKRVIPEGLSGIRIKMINSLVRRRSLERYRLLDEYYMIAVDIYVYCWTRCTLINRHLIYAGKTRGNIL